MAALSIQVPYPVFYDRDGQPLDNGNVYIGTAYLDPVTNPIQVYYDETLTIPANQPLKTSNGYVYRNGTPTQLYVNAVNFSILVNDSKNTLVYSFPDGTGFSPNASNVAFTGFKGQVGYVSDLAGNDGSDWIGFTSAGTGAVARSAQDKMRDIVSVKDFGAVGDGVADDSAALQAAANTGRPINLDGASYFTTSTITITNDIIGPGEITGDASGGAVNLIAVDADNVTLRDVTLTGNSANAAASANVAVSAENQSWLTLQNCTIKNGRIRHRNTQLSYQYGLRIENCDIDCDFTLNDYVVTQNDIITVRGINGVWIENNNITFTNCHRVAKLADTEGWVSGQVTAYRTRNVSFSGNTITGSTGSNKQVVDMFNGLSDAVLIGNNVTVTGFSRVFENKTDSIAQPWNQNITVANNHLSNDSLVLNFAGTYGDSNPAVDVGWQNLTIIGNTIICTAAAAATAVIVRWQHDLVFTNNQIIAPAANALTTGGNALQIYGTRFCTFNSNTVKYGNVLFSTISTGADRTHAPVMLSIAASNNTVEEFGATSSTTGRGGFVFANMATAETANLSINVNGNAFYKSTSPVLSNAGAVAFITCTIAEVLVVSNNAKFATASEERVIILTSTITQFGAENNSWDFYGTAASASTLNLPGGQVVEITGTSNISTITAANNAGRRVSLIFRDVLTVNDGSNLRLAGNFTTSADDTLSLVCDGTNWYETSRSAN